MKLVYCKRTSLSALHLTDFSISGAVTHLREKRNNPDTPDTETLIELAQAVWEKYLEAEFLNEDDAGNPKFSWVGSHIQRVPAKALWETVVGPSFWDARRMGFMGTYELWCSMIRSEGAKMMAEIEDDDDDEDETA